LLSGFVFCIDQFVVAVGGRVLVINSGSESVVRLHLLLHVFLHWLRPSLMVVRHVACLAHAHGVQKAIGVPAPRRILVSSELPVAR